MYTLVMMMERPVTVQTIRVVNTSPQPQEDWRTGWSVLAEAWAMMP